MRLRLDRLTLTPRRAIALACLVLVSLTASACAIAAGETRRGPEPLRPVGDALAEGTAKLAFPWTPAAGAPTSIGEIVQTAGDASAAAVTVRILAGGTGVSLRSDCTDAARAGGAWTDGTSVDVVEYGSGRCAGWTKATSGSTSSWVRDEYLQGLPAPANRTELGVSSSTPGDPALGQLRGWTGRVLDGAGRIALLSRHAPTSTEAGFTLKSLEKVQEDMRVLAAEIAAAEAAPAAACAAPRRPTIDAANMVGDLARQLHVAFASGGGTPATMLPAVERFLATEQEAARLITACAKR